MAVRGSKASSKARTRARPRRSSRRWACVSRRRRRRADRAWRRHRRPARSGRAVGLRQRRHRDAPAGRAAVRAAVRQRAGRRCLAVATADAARDRSAVAHGRAHRCQTTACRRCASTADSAWSASTTTLPVASAQVKSALLLAACRRRRYPRARTASDPRLHRTHAARVRRRHRFRARLRAAARWTAAARDRHPGADRFFLGRLLPGRREPRAGIAAAYRAMSA